jgi:hypothetical protein
MSEHNYPIEVQLQSAHHPQTLSVTGRKDDWPQLLDQAQELARRTWRPDLTVVDNGYPLAALCRPGDEPDAHLLDGRQYAYCTAWRANAN